MADDKLFDDDALDNGAENADGDSDLGNLPPLSDFDSQGEPDMGDALPPLGDFESQDTDLAGKGSQPPLEADDTFSPQTPDIGQGNVNAYQTEDEDIGLPAFDSGSFNEGPVDDGQMMSAGGFQDLAADSDFSPETPDIGPGPDSSLDTPIFDSAFGGEDSGFGDIDSGFGSGQRDTATQAMESPMFDDFGGEGDFAAPEGAAAPGATPVPDFSPDTGFGGEDDFVGAGVGAPVGAGVGAAPAAMPAMGEEVPSSQKAAGKKAGVSPLVVVVFGVIALVIGMITSPFMSEYLPFLPNPMEEEVANRDRQIAALNEQINAFREASKGSEENAEVSEERLSQLLREIPVRQTELDNLSGQIASTRATLETQQRELGNVERELRERNDEIIAAREFLEELRNETAIVQARQRGLIAEVDRLTGHVGELEEANVRRVATKEALAHNVDRLIIQIKESIPLTPQRFDYAQRLAAVKQLREKVDQASWVTPELQNEYTGLYLRELELARANEYFFARITVTDRFGSRSQKWAECLMRGNWAVYYRTLDGANIGSFENIGTPEVPLWGYREDMPQDVQLSIEANIVNARIPDFESQVQLLAERELAGQKGTVWQRTYSSL
ncbi:MAG TPA: hypothetical protein ENN29_12720 [Candidatus Hydrogenedentes bacterium]|nr:hypothetical protein [Candidatus Hydrogenedentota bacterium]